MIARLVRMLRRNHALEHATIAVLSGRRGLAGPLMGRASLSGFSIYGLVGATEVENAAREALERLQRGERELAISPLCGTNLAVAGLAAGLASLVAIGGRSRWQRWPQVLLATLLALLAAQPLGRWVQQHVTTSPYLAGTKIRRVVSRQRGNWLLHRVEIEASPEGSL